MIHQFNPNMAPDSDFESGSFAHLAEGNLCRLLDSRRTPGFIESICKGSGFFRWRISDFEDKGKTWDVPIEDVARYQFKKGSKLLSVSESKVLSELADHLSEPLVISPEEFQKSHFKSMLVQSSTHARAWLEEKSTFFVSENDFNFDSTQGSNSLSADLLNYLSEQGLDELERKTAEVYVLNPQSGEWLKGMQIVAAEMGMKEFRGTIVRTHDIFQGIGSKENRRKYLLARLGFVIAMYGLLGREEVILYRGMSSSSDWKSGVSKFFSSWSFSKKVAESFTRFEMEASSKHSYLIKRTMPTHKLFMTYVETKEMNQQYKEVEAVVVHDQYDYMLW